MDYAISSVISRPQPNSALSAHPSKAKKQNSFYEPLRMKRWLSIHSLMPKKFRDQDEKRIYQKFPILKFKINGDTIEENFKEFKEEQYQMTIKHQLEQVQRDNQASAQAKQIFGIVTTESDNPYDDTDSEEDIPQINSNRRLSSARGKITADSMKNLATKSKFSQPQAKFQQAFQQSKQEMFRNLKNKFKSIDVQSKEIELKSQSQKSQAAANRHSYSGIKITNNFSKSSLLYVTSNKTSQHAIESQADSVSHRLEQPQARKKSKRDSIQIKQHAKQQLQEKVILHKHTVKVLRPSSSHVSLFRVSQSSSTFHEPKKFLSHQQSLTNINLNLNSYQLKIKQEQQLKQPTPPIPEEQSENTQKSRYLDSVWQNHQNSQNDYLLNLNNANNYEYVPKQVYFKYTKKPKFYPHEPIPALYDKGCLTCGQKNVEVKFHGERHVCFKCKKYVQTPDGQPVMLISTPDQRILAFYKKLKAQPVDGRKFSYIEIDPNDMRIFDKHCFATYAGVGELILLLKDESKE